MQTPPPSNNQGRHTGYGASNLGTSNTETTPTQMMNGESEYYDSTHSVRKSTSTVSSMEFHLYTKL